MESTALVDAEPEKIRENRIFAIQTRALVYVRNGRHDDAVALLDAWAKDLRDPEPRFIECLARFPSDPARATQLFERAKKEWNPSIRDMYDVLLLHDEVQELVRRHAPDAKADSDDATPEGDPKAGAVS